MTNQSPILTNHCRIFFKFIKSYFCMTIANIAVLHNANQTPATTSRSKFDIVQFNVAKERIANSSKKSACEIIKFCFNG